MLEVLFTQVSNVEDLFCGASSDSEPSLFFSNYFFSLGFKRIQDDFQHVFAQLEDLKTGQCGKGLLRSYLWCPATFQGYGIE